MTAETCTGVVFTVTPTNIANGIIPDGTTYTWTEPQYSANISGGNTGSGPAITGTLLNSAAVPGTATYTVTPITTLCGINESFTNILKSPITISITEKVIKTINQNYQN